MRKKQILIVEDNISYLSLCVDYFHERKWSVTTAINGKLAWRSFNNSPEKFDCILTDNNMPEMSGEKLIGILRENGFNIPAVLMSGRPDSIEYDESRDPMTVILAKPFSLSCLDKIFLVLASQNSI